MTPLNLREVRDQIPLLQSTVYLDNAGAGPPPAAVTDSMRGFLDEWSNRGENWEAWLLEIVRARQLFAKLIGGSLDEVACLPNVTSALGAIATAIPAGRDSNVVVSELNFPTNVYLWHSLRRKGLIGEVRLLRATKGEVPLSEYEKAIDDKTAAVSVDHVSWINGCRENVVAVTELAHAHGALVLVDAFHAIGVMPVDARNLGVDVVVCGTYKWLMGPHGTAFLYVRKGVLDRLNASIIGWHGISDSVIARVLSKQDTFGRPFNLTGVEEAGNATRFEWGTWSMITVIGAAAALDFTLRYPPSERAPLIDKLTEHLISRLLEKKLTITSPVSKERRSGIVTFRVPDAGGFAKKLQAQGIIVAPRVDTLRVSPHFYNSEEEIDKLLEKI